MRKLILIGTADSIFKVPYDNNEYEIWGVGTTTCMPSVKRLDKIFELHNKKTVEWLVNERKCMYGRFQCPIFVRDIYEIDNISNTVNYPKEEVLKYCNDVLNLPKGYFTSTLPYMIAYAIIQGYEEISLMLIHLSYDSEYFHERNCVEFWLGHAITKGIKINIPPDSEILQHRFMYGFEEQSIAWENIRSKKLFLERQKSEALANMLNCNTIVNQFEAMKGIIELIDKNDLEKINEVKEKVNNFYEKDMNNYQTNYMSSKQIYDESTGCIDMLEYFE